jgi:SagB-type dehydrogenase family enzyme
METLGEKFQRETKYSVGERPPASRILSHPDDFKSYPGVSKMLLPIPEGEDGPGVWRVMAERRSVRNFSSQSISRQDLARLLWAIGGIRERRHGFLFRTVPSAGALYPLETYILANNVENVERGVYHFHVPTFSLEFISPGYHSLELTKAALGQEMVMESAVTLIWTAVIDRCRVKYGERAFRYIYLDSGHMGQNLYLAATAMGLGCCTIGAFFDDKVNDVLGVDGREETVVYMGVVGPPL